MFLASSLFRRRREQVEFRNWGKLVAEEVQMIIERDWK